MTYKCPYCRNEISEGDFCSQCLKHVAWVKLFWSKSALYYNEGYRAAKCRNLTLAEVYLKKAVMLNKYNIEARNLLGLVYYETGQVANALKEWIISQSFKREGNLAADYIETVQKEMKKLEYYKESIALYNQALTYVKQRNMDMAIIRLKKAISLNPKLVRGRVLLGLCYMYDKQYNKANEMIKKALLIDVGEKEALKYYYELNIEEKESAPSYPLAYHVKQDKEKEISPEKVIDRGNVFYRYIMYFMLGVISVAIIFNYMILPSKVRDYKQKMTEMIQTEGELQQKIQDTTRNYDVKLKELEGNKKDLESKVTGYEQQLDIFTQKQRLSDAQQSAEQGKYEEAASQIYNIAKSQLDENDATQYDELKADVYKRANEMLYSEGMQAYNQSDFATAISKFEIILLYEPEERMARRSLYYLGCSELENNSLEEGKKHLTKLISEYEGSYEAGLAEGKISNLSS